MIEKGDLRIFNASAKQIDPLVEMLWLVHHESPELQRYPFSEEKARAVVRNLVNNDDGNSLALVAYKGETLIGCMGAKICEQLTSVTPLAIEMLLYVAPEYRGGRAAFFMVRAFEDWAGPYDMKVGSSLGINDPGVVKFYERLGYRQSNIGMSKRGAKNV